MNIRQREGSDQPLQTRDLEDCLHHFVIEQAGRNPRAVAILAPGRTSLTYGRLRRQVEEVLQEVNSRGFGRHDRIAMMLPEGPEMAVAFVAIAAAATCAPLNPAYRTRELNDSLRDLNATALLVLSGSESAAVAVARSRGIPVLELIPETGMEAGLFRLAGDSRPRLMRHCFAQPDDTALALQTSGTAARPKVVSLTHRNISDSARNIRAAVQLMESDRCLSVMPLFHIHGLSTLFASLAAGASVICTSGFSVAQFFESLAAFCPTWYSAAPTIHQAILAGAALYPDTAERSSLRFLRSASAAMPRQVMADLERVFRVPLIEAYGMTEAGPQIASNRLSGRKTGSVGRAAGPEVAIMDQTGNLMPLGEAGEIVIRGTSVMRAYENDPTANRSAFVREWLRTGDLGYLDTDSFLFITGRLKEIINRGGEKISPLEVDEVLMEHPAVAQVATFSVPHPALGESVAAAIVLKSDFPGPGRSSRDANKIECLIKEIREFAASRLAPFKVPQQVLIVDEIPKSPTGKVCRMDLAERLNLVPPTASQTQVHAIPAGHNTPLEQRLASIWAEVLRIDQPALHDNFFQLGGHSLSATQVVARLSREFGVDLPIDSLFVRPTVAGLAERVAKTLRASRAQPPLEQQSTRKAEVNSNGASIPRRSLTGPCPLSFAQERFWFLNQVESGNPAYNVSASLWLRGRLDETVLEGSLNEIRRRHDTLRTTFHLIREEPVQTIAPVQAGRLAVVDLTTLPSSNREAEALRLAAAEGERPFDLNHEPLFRAILVRINPEEHVLLLTAHHIIVDGWSTGVLYRELGILYDAFLSGKTSPLPELPIQYADFAVWQRAWLREEVLESQLTFWKKQLRDVPPGIELPTDHLRPAFQTYRGSRRPVVIPASLKEGLQALSLQEEVTLFMTTMAAFQTWLFRYTGQDDFLVGVPIANRNHLETEALIGFFTNTLVLRADLAGDPTFRKLLGRVRAAAKGAYAHQDLPFEKLVEELHPKRDPSRMPLFQVMFAFQNLPNGGTPPRRENGQLEKEPETLAPQVEASVSGPQFELAAGLNAQPFKLDNGTAKFDLTLYLWETKQGLGGAWQYNVDLFEAATVERIARHFQTLLEGVVANPDRRISEFPLLAEAEQYQLEVEWNQTARPDHREVCFHHLFEEQAEQTPDAVAIYFEEERLTYRELNGRANQLARHLQGVGVGPETLVGICLKRSAEIVVALLGVMKAGGAYLPLDPEYPTERLALMLEDAQVSAVITEQSLLPILDPKHRISDWVSVSGQSSTGSPEPKTPILVCLETDQEIIAREETQNPESGATAANLAYVIYTSGSTGRPKGVMIAHTSVCHYVQAMRDAVGVAGSDRYLHTASFGFSSSVRQFAVPLSCGAAIVMAPTDHIRDPRALFDLIRRHHVSIIDIVPSYWRSCIQELQCMEATSRAALLNSELRLILSASESLSADVPREWAFGFRHGAQLINMFGQTETTGIVTVYPIPASSTGIKKGVPVGRPIPNTRVYVLDPSRRPVPVGVYGDVYIGSAGIGRGYLGQPELTAERFVPDPFSLIPGARLYRTGDAGRYRPDGVIELIGRADDQIKVRGFRIEPGEIEAALRQHPAVWDSVVVPQEEAPGLDPATGVNGPMQITRGSQRLVAFVVPRERFQASASSGVQVGPFQRRKRLVELREFLKRKLPEYMVPSALVEMGALPLTPNGKVDRKALSTRFVACGMELTGQEPSPSFAAPSTPAEKALATIWEEVLNLNCVGVEDNFFDLGGDSLLGMRMIRRANQAGLQIGVRQLFDHQTIAELAQVAGALQTVPAEAEWSAGSNSKPPGAARPNHELPFEQKAPSEALPPLRQASVVNEVGGAVRVTLESLRAFSREALERAGLLPEGAAIVTEVQIEASLRGQPTHNIDSIPRYARRIASGATNPRPQIRIERETAISAQIDGDNGPGQWVSVVAMETAIRKAQQNGIAIVGARRSNHFGAAGHYAWLAAKEGLIGLCTTNGRVILAPTGGLTPTFGNNPLGVGVPAKHHHPILLDIAMSVAPRGKIGLHLAEGKPLLPGWILDRFGRPSTDPADLAAGLGVPIGGHKGYGLALVMEVLAGALTGAGFCSDHSREQMRQSAEPPDVGHFFMAIDPGIFMPLAEFTMRVDQMIDQTKEGERAQDVEEILIPGEVEFRARAQNIQNGIPLRPVTYQALRRYGEGAGINTELVLVH